MPNQTSEVSQKGLNEVSNDNNKKAYHVAGKPSSLFSSLPYYFLATLIVVSYYSIVCLQNPFIMIFILYVALPVVDNWLPHDWLNPDKHQTKDLNNEDFWFKLPLYVTTVVDWVITYALVKHLVEGEHNIIMYFGTIVMNGTFSSTNFMIAHELFHKNGFIPKFVGTITMSKHLYMHFFIEHNLGHHKRVGTPEDPATSRQGESLYSFLPRTLVGSYKSAWHLENERLIKHEGYRTPYVPANRMIWFIINNILFPMGVYHLFGFKGLAIFLAIAAYTVFYLEIINYIEHYGLMRNKINETEYEKVDIRHSWNAPHKFTNYLLFKLQRHSDHHENGWKSYQTLLTLDESPMLPHGYSLSLVMSLFPSIWFKVMNTCLAAYKANRDYTAEENKLIKSESKKTLMLLATICGVASYINYMNMNNTF